MKSGKLYVIGVGPGDPELLTIKGLRILESIRCICVPKGREEGSSLALSIVKKIVNVDSKEIIEAYFPMKKTRSNQQSAVSSHEPGKDNLNSKWNGTVENISDRLNKGMAVAFITLGDPTIYSTFFYLYDRLLEKIPGLDIEIVPGISSINASAALAKISLGLAGEKIAVLPATYVENLRDIFENFDTIVLMKIHSVFDKVLALLKDMGIAGKATYISKAGMEDERIFHDIYAVKEEDMNYFSIVIIRK